MSNEPNIRNRVAGAVVLVSLAVIFLPLILDGKKKNQILDSYIPEKPQAGEIILVNVEESLQANKDTHNPPTETNGEEKPDSVTIDVNEIIEDTKKNTGEKELVAKKIATKVTPPKPEPKRDNRPSYKLKGHLVQLGGFGTKNNASKLVGTLKAKGYKAYYKTGRSNGKPLYRVFAGPYLKKSEAESAMAKMKKLAAIEPIVVTYDPIKHAQN